jgi:hypothetical protein
LGNSEFADLDYRLNVGVIGDVTLQLGVVGHHGLTEGLHGFKGKR